MGGVYCNRTQNGEQFFQKECPQPAPIGCVQLLCLQNMDIFIVQLLNNLPPAFLLIVHQAHCPGIHQFQLLPRRQTFLAGNINLSFDLTAQSGNPDHEKFIKVVGGDGQEPKPFKQWVLLAFRRL